MTGEPVTPFKGLAAFTDSELDALLFFGRERDIQTIAANLIASRFTVLYGASGVGKSSVLSAGVVRRTRELAPDALVVAHREWTGGDLLGGLSAAIPGLEPASGRSLADALAELAETRGSEIYLALDQFEEVFLHRGSAAFVRALAEVVTRPGLRAHVLVSVREDALSELDVFTGLIPNVFGNYLPLDRLDRESARLAITGPVARMAELTPGVQVEVEPGLVEAVLDQTGVGRVALGGVALGGVAAADTDRIEAPYLQLVMQRLWESEREQGSSALRRTTLEELGGARGILRAHLERALGALEPDERDAAARMFHHLVTPSGTKIAHRVADLAEYADVPEDVVRRVLAKLAPRRIVRPLDGSVELYHDVLADAVLAWRTQHDAERRLEQQRAASHARQRRLAIAVAVCLVALAAMTALTVYALSQRSDARANARKARGNARLAGAKRLDAIASGLIPVAKVQVDPELGLLLAARAARVAPDPPADDILRRALLQSLVRRVLPDREVSGIAYSPDAQRLAIGTHGGTARVYGHDLKTPVASLDVGAPIVAVALSHDGRRVVTVTEGGTALLWQVASGRRIASLGRARTQVSFSPDDASIVTADRREVRVFRATDGSRVATLPLPAHVEVATFSPRGDRVVVAAGRAVRTYLPSGGRALATVDHGATVKSVVVTPDERMLVTAGHNHVVRVWALPGGQPVRNLIGHRTDVTSLALLPTRPVLVSTGTGGSARLWDLRGGQPLLELTGHTNHVTGATFDRKGGHVLTWSKDGTARVWNVDDGKAIAVLAAGRAAVTNAVFGPGGLVITRAADGRVRLWRPQLTPRLAVLTRAGASAGAAAFTRDGRRLAVATPSAVLVFDDRGRRLARVRVASAQPVALSDDGARVAYAVGRRVVVRRVPDGRVDDDFTAPSTPRALAFSPGGGVLAVGTRTGEVRARRLATDETTVLPSDAAAVTSLAFSRAGDRIAAGHSRGFVTVWRSSGGRALLSWLGHRRGTPVLGVAFNRSGRLLATAGQDTDVHVWKARNGEPVTNLTGQFAIVSGAAFSPDSRWVVSAGPGSAGLWDLAEQQRLLFLDGHKGKLLAAAFVAGSRRIETVGVDGTIRAYECGVCGRVPELLRLAAARLAATGRRLTTHDAQLLGIG